MADVYIHSTQTVNKVTGKVGRKIDRGIIFANSLEKQRE